MWSKLELQSQSYLVDGLAVLHLKSNDTDSVPVLRLVPVHRLVFVLVGSREQEKHTLVVSHYVCHDISAPCLQSSVYSFKRDRVIPISIVLEAEASTVPPGSLKRVSDPEVNVVKP